MYIVRRVKDQPPDNPWVYCGCINQSAIHDTQALLQTREGEGENGVILRQLSALRYQRETHRSEQSPSRPPYEMRPCDLEPLTCKLGVAAVAKLGKREAWQINKS